MALKAVRYCLLIRESKEVFYLKVPYLSLFEELKFLKSSLFVPFSSYLHKNQ
jgi:hypothetical protein